MRYSLLLIIWFIEFAQSQSERVFEIRHLHPQEYSEGPVLQKRASPKKGSPAKGPPAKDASQSMSPPPNIRFTSSIPRIQIASSPPALPGLAGISGSEQASAAPQRGSSAPLPIGSPGRGALRNDAINPAASPNAGIASPLSRMGIGSPSSGRQQPLAAAARHGSLPSVQGSTGSGGLSPGSERRRSNEQKPASNPSDRGSSPDQIPRPRQRGKKSRNSPEQQIQEMQRQRYREATARAAQQPIDLTNWPEGPRVPHPSPQNFRPPATYVPQGGMMGAMPGTLLPQPGLSPLWQGRSHALGPPQPATHYSNLGPYYTNRPALPVEGGWMPQNPILRAGFDRQSSQQNPGLGDARGTALGGQHGQGSMMPQPYSYSPHDAQRFPNARLSMGLGQPQQRPRRDSDTRSGGNLGAARGSPGFHDQDPLRRLDIVPQSPSQGTSPFATNVGNQTPRRTNMGGGPNNPNAQSSLDFIRSLPYRDESYRRELQEQQAHQAQQAQYAQQVQQVQQERQRQEQFRFARLGAIQRQHQMEQLAQSQSFQQAFARVTAANRQGQYRQGASQYPQQQPPPPPPPRQYLRQYPQQYASEQQALLNPGGYAPSQALAYAHEHPQLQFLLPPSSPQYQQQQQYHQQQQPQAQQRQGLGPGAAQAYWQAQAQAQGQRPAQGQIQGQAQAQGQGRGQGQAQAQAQGAAQAPGQPQGQGQGQGQRRSQRQRRAPGQWPGEATGQWPGKATGQEPPSPPSSRTVSQGPPADSPP